MNYQVKPGTISAINNSPVNVDDHDEADVIANSHNITRGYYNAARRAKQRHVVVRHFADRYYRDHCNH
jgi:hypothetical protein